VEYGKKIALANVRSTILGIKRKLFRQAKIIKDVQPSKIRDGITEGSRKRKRRPKSISRAGIGIELEK